MRDLKINTSPFEAATARERDWGSSVLMKTFSSPVEMYANGKGLTGAVSDSGRPSKYFFA